MKKLLSILLFLPTLSTFSQSLDQKHYREDFDYFWKTIGDNYCYFNKKQVDWDKLKPGFDRQIDTVSSRNSFIGILEKTCFELYDHHCSLRTNTKHSRRLVPTATDIWAAYREDKPIVLEVRKGMGAEKVGIKAGMEIISVNGVAVDEAIRPFLGHTINTESKSFALRLLLAGDHVTPRKIRLLTKKGMVDFSPDTNGMLLEHIKYSGMVESRVFNNIGYIKINNFLYDNKIIPVFDSVLNSFIKTRALIIDLRETPSGGNTSVARAILGRFISKEHFYQKHELYAEEKETGIKRSWMEIVSPRGITYNKQVVVIANHWTGSIGEGITIAFDGMKRATVIGTQLARLNGAVDSFEMENTKIGFNLPTERIYHINGTPRELYEPKVIVDVRSQEPGKDVILETAIHYLK